MGGPGSGRRPSGKIKVSINGKKLSFSEKGAARASLHKRKGQTKVVNASKKLGRLRVKFLGKGLNKSKGN
jgi:hypothetical protein